MALVSSNSYSVLSKRRGMQLRAERLYEEKFHSRWCRDPSARATRNQYRQLLSDNPGPDTSRQEPYMNTLIRGDYYGHDGDQVGRKRPKRFGAVLKNKILQGQPRLSSAQRRILARTLDASLLSVPRTEPRFSTQRAKLAATETSDHQLLSREQVYWDHLHHLNRRRRVDFHKAYLYGRDQRSAMSMALTDSNFDRMRREPEPQTAGAGPRLDEGEVAPEDIAMGFGDTEFHGEPPPPPPAPPPPATPPPSADPLPVGRVRRGLNDARRAAAAYAEPAAVLMDQPPPPPPAPLRRKAQAALGERLSRPRARARRKTAQQETWRPGASMEGALAATQHHHVSVADHSDRRVGQWRNPTHLADQRVPVVPTDA